MSYRLFRNKKTAFIFVAIIGLAGFGVAYATMGYLKNPAPLVSQSPAPSQSNDTKVHAGPSTDTSTPTAAPPANPSHPISSTLTKPIGPNNNTSTVSLSGVTSMESTCRSAAGVSCYIQATKNDAVIILSDTKTISRDGVILDWDANKLTVGTWSIQAVAVSGNQKISSDVQLLKVTQ